MPYNYTQSYKPVPVSFLDSKGKKFQRGVLGVNNLSGAVATQNNPGAIAISPPPSWATGSIVSDITSVLAPVLTFDCRGMTNDSYMLRNIGNEPILSFTLEVQVELNSYNWEPIATTAADFNDSGLRTNNSHKIVQRCTGVPQLSPNSVCFLTLNLEYCAGLRMQASCPTGKTTRLLIEGTHVWDWNKPPE